MRTKLLLLMGVVGAWCCAFGQAPSRFDVVSMDAPKEAQHDAKSMDILSRNDKITIKLNGRAVAEHAGDPKRSKVGPIG